MIRFKTMRKELFFTALIAALCVAGCSSKSVRDIENVTVNENVGETKHRVVEEEPEKGIYYNKTREEEAVKPYNLFTSETADMGEAVEFQSMQIIATDVEIYYGTDEIPDKYWELIKREGMDVGCYGSYQINGKTPMTVCVTFKIKNLSDKDEDVGLGYLDIGNMYTKGDYKYFDIISRDRILFYGSGNTGKRRNFVYLRAGEEKELVAVYMAIPEKTWKSADRLTDKILEYYDECTLSDVYMKTATTGSKKNSTAQDETLINLHIKDNKVQK